MSGSLCVAGEVTNPDKLLSDAQAICKARCARFRSRRCKGPSVIEADLSLLKDQDGLFITARPCPLVALRVED